MALLITQTLVSAWAYMFDCYEGQEDAAREDFERTLRREKGEPTEAMLDGIAFENAVYDRANGISHQRTPWESGVQAVADILCGAQFQVRLSRPITVDGEEYIIHGVLDALLAGTIFDVKKTSAKGGLNNRDFYGKYLNSPQHPFYFYLAPEVMEFKYLLSDGEDVYIEAYRPAECRSAEDVIREFARSMKDLGYWEIYKEKWVAK